MFINSIELVLDLLIARRIELVEVCSTLVMFPYIDISLTTSMKDEAKLVRWNKAIAFTHK